MFSVKFSLWKNKGNTCLFFLQNPSHFSLNSVISETLSLFLIYDGKNISAKGLSLLSINFDDLSLNIELIGTNVKEDFSNYEIVELKKLSQSKLNAKELAHIIYTHNKVVNSGLPNYQGCAQMCCTYRSIAFIFP
jgi:hypothetical protein